MAERENGLRPLVAVDVVIFSVRGEELVALLVRREDAPFAGAWALPGGYLQPAESLDEAARRELREETGVTDVYLEQLYTFGAPDRDPRERTLSVSYFALLDFERAGPLSAERGTRIAEPVERGGRSAERGVPTTADSSLPETPHSALRTPRSTGPALRTPHSEWHPVHALPPLAFDHAAIIEYACLRLRWKLEYTNAVYSLLPERFTLSEIQRVYEIILRKPLDKRNFRKWLLGTRLVEPTGQVRRAGRHRPAQLYRFQAREIRMW